MAEERVTRKLAAILAADMVGFSRLMEKDEEGTIAHQKLHRAELIDPNITEHGGRIVKSTGDGLLVEFASAVDAVRCAAEIQRAMAGREADVPQNRRIAYRVGINIGDIVIDGDDILGDGVNIAARLEALAAPGGVCVSGTVHEHVASKLDLAFEDMGEQKVKNIERPVRAYRVQLEEMDQGNGGAAASRKSSLELPDKPSIAVLSFDNMSGDPEQEYFADGITEDIITALSRVTGLFVVARNSSFAYKGRAVDMKQVARELGVAYVLEGSVRKAGSRVRVTAQLIDGAGGNHVWAERYDRELEDIFAIQDEITESVAGAVTSQISSTEIKRAARKRLDDLGSWERIWKAWSLLHQTTEADNAAAREICLQELARAADNYRALTALAYGYAIDSVYGWGELSPTEAGGEAARAARAAIAIEPNEERAHTALALILWMSGQHEAAIREAETAIKLNPNDNRGHHMLGAALGYSGTEYRERAVRHLALGIRLDPRNVWVAWPPAPQTYRLRRPERFPARRVSTSSRQTGRTKTKSPATGLVAGLYLVFWLRGLATSVVCTWILANCSRGMKWTRSVEAGHLLMADLCRLPLRQPIALARYMLAGPEHVACKPISGHHHRCLKCSSMKEEAHALSPAL